jgi:hypothetical protein
VGEGGARDGPSERREARCRDEKVRVEGAESRRRSRRSGTTPDGRALAGHVRPQHVLVLCVVARNVPADGDAHRDRVRSGEWWQNQWSGDVVRVNALGGAHGGLAGGRAFLV